MKRIFRITNSLNWYGMPIKLLEVGTKVKLNSKYYSGDKQTSAIITGKVIREAEFTESITKDGFTHQELYTCTLPDGTSTVLWPEEIDYIDKELNK